MDFKKVRGNVEVYSPAKKSREITIGKEGGILLCNDCGKLAESQYIVMEVTNLNTEQLEFRLEFYKEGNELGKPELYVVFGCIPQIKVTMYLDMDHLSSQKIFLERTPGKLSNQVWGSPLKKEEVISFGIGFREYYKEQKFILHDIYFSNEKPDCSLKDPRPIVDSLGQLKFRDWPDKTKSELELESYMESLIDNELKETYDSIYNYSRYGGYKEKRFEASGFFRLEKDDRWWLVDPDGYAFFSTGLDCIGSNTEGKIDSLEELFDWLPEKNGEFASAYADTPMKGFPGVYFDFYKANLIKAFGEKWWDSWARITKSRLNVWGFNTIGNWSDKEFIKWAKMPYVQPLGGFPTTEKRIFRDFPDVYSDEYRVNSVEYAKQMEQIKDDPLLIGYFMQNEPNWAFAGDINLAREMFRYEDSFVTKDKLIEFLENKYEGDIEGLNRVWKTSHTDFYGLRNMNHDTISPKADKDLLEFTALMVAEYVRIPSVELKKIDPNHLNLGMRYAWISTDLIFNGFEYMDVFTINCYKIKPDSKEIKYIYEKTGKPSMIGEYHFGAPDSGLMAGALVTVLNQEERGVAYRYYTEEAASIKELIGLHYFTLGDMAVLGRAEGATMNIGLVDACQKPYKAFVEGVINTHANLYDVLTGRRDPSDTKPVEIHRTAY